MEHCTSRTHRERDPFEQVLIGLLSAAFVFYPIPGLAQQSEKQTQQTDSARTPDVYLLPTNSVRDQISEIVPDRIGEMLRGRLDSEGQLNLLPSLRQMNKTPGGPGEVNAAIKEARKQYTSGIGLVEAGNYQEAADQFSRAVETLRENIADLDNFDIYTDALANLARSYWEIGHNYDARSSIREFAHIVPDAELDPDKYAAGLRELYDEEVARVDKAGTGTLVVEADVEGASVYIDGEKKGETPVSIEDTAFGYHYLVVRSDQGGVWSQKLQVKGRDKKQSYDVELGAGSESDRQADEGDAEEELPAFYTELQSAIKDGNFGAELQPYLEELAKQTGVDFVSWVVMIKDEEASEYVAAPFVYRVSDGMFVQPDNVGFNFQLSNLTVGVSKLHTRIVETIEEMPEDKAVTSVSLVDDEPEDEPTVAAGTTGDTQKTTGSTDESGATMSTNESIDAPPEAKPSNESSAWKYIGITGAILAVGGLAAGGAFLLAGPNEGTKPSGFTANVEW